MRRAVPTPQEALDAMILSIEIWFSSAALARCILCEGERSSSRRASPYVAFVTV
jgi:hypothetical protein